MKVEDLHCPDHKDAEGSEAASIDTDGATAVVITCTVCSKPYGRYRLAGRLEPRTPRDVTRVDRDGAYPARGGYGFV